MRRLKLRLGLNPNNPPDTTQAPREINIISKNTANLVRLYASPRLRLRDTLLSPIMDVARQAIAWATDVVFRPRYARLVVLTLLFFDAFMSCVIIKKVPYTEIDWEAYMEQISQYRAGERDYRNIKGGTGPLVYPAGHVYIFNWLYGLTDGGVQRGRVQVAFWMTYMATLWLVMSCYRKASVPPWVMIFLVLSKRLHSIYLLRFFNDCFSTLLIFAAIYLIQNRQYTLSALFCSLSVGVKMSSLLYLPAFGIIYLFSTGDIGKTFRLGVIMAQVQMLLAFPFVVSENGSLRGYVGRAFEFGRVFMWKWTVNWRFVGEEVFTSPFFKFGLLGLHVGLLLFFLTTRWLRPSGNSIQQFARFLFVGTDDLGKKSMSQITDSAYMLTTLFTCNMIGILCARSLHYQFYSWMAWTTPYLLWKSGWGCLYVGTVWLVQEYAWNVYPSSKLSSALAVSCILIQLIGVWVGTSTALGDQDNEANKTKIR